MSRPMETLFEASRAGRVGYALPPLDVPGVDCGEALQEPAGRTPPGCRKWQRWMSSDTSPDCPE